MTCVTADTSSDDGENGIRMPKKTCGEDTSIQKWELSLKSIRKTTLFNFVSKCTINDLKSHTKVEQSNHTSSYKATLL